MSQISAFLRSSIGRKVVMAASGLLLIGFLITHVAANLLVLFDEEAFNHYSHALISNPAIYLAELALFVLFVAHFANGFIVERRNRQARPEKYQNKQRAGGPSRRSLASGTMIFSGLVVLAFVPIHILGFKFGAYYESATDPGVRDLARLVFEEFSDPGHVIFYTAVMLILGFHSFHGVSSAFESLGISHRTWLRNAARGLAVAIFGGFIAIPITIYFFMGGSS